MTILTNIKIYTENEIIDNGWISFDEKILEYGQGTHPDGIDMGGKLLIPGYIDQHIHGLMNADTMDASIHSLKTIAEHLPLEGTTSFLATTMTDTKENIVEALRTVREFMEMKTIGAECLGVHLEGPFISELYKGAQRGDAIQEISLELFKEYQLASGGTIKQVTIAPELNNALALISYMKEEAIVASIGHTNATGKEAMDAVDHGCTCFTHAFNAMSKLHHRDVGAVGAMLLTDTYAELIADTIHLSNEATELLYKLKTPRKLILVTDAMRAKLLPDGKYELGGQPVIVKDKASRLLDGSLAGSILRYEDGVVNFQKITNATVEELIQVSSVNPAKNHNVYDRKGSITIGKDADINILNHDLTIYTTYAKGITKN